MDRKKTVRFGKHRIPMPSSMWLRIALGVLLCLGGLMWFLPVLGLWMLPLGIMVFSVDFPVARRLRRRVEVWGGPIARRLQQRYVNWRSGRRPQG